MKQKLLALGAVLLLVAVCSALYQNCAFLSDEDGNTPLHSLIYEADRYIREALKLLHDQEAITGEEHTTEYKRWSKMLKRKLLSLNSELLADLNALRSNACFEYMLTAENNQGETVRDLLEDFPMVDEEDAEYLGLKYPVTNRFYDKLERILSSQRFRSFDE